MTTNEASDGALGRIDRTSGPLGAEVYDTLLDALMEGRIHAGDRLIMDRLAEDLDVSRTPVRDALQRLYREGVIEPAGRRGFIVREPSPRDTKDFYEARIAIEGHAAAQLAQGFPRRLESLRRFLSEIAVARPGSTRQSFENNRDFHRGVVFATENKYLIDMFDTIWNRSRTALTFRQFATSNPAQDFTCEHEQLIVDLQGAGPAEARRSMTEHIRSGLVRTRLETGQE